MSCRLGGLATWAIGTPDAWRGALCGDSLLLHLSCRCSWPVASLVVTQHRPLFPNWSLPTSLRRHQHQTQRTRPRPQTPQSRRRRRQLHRTQRPLLRPQTLPPRRRLLHHTPTPTNTPSPTPPLSTPTAVPTTTSELAATPIRDTDREALVAIYDATNGEFWARRQNWLSNAPIGTWHGVTTNASGRVTELNLSENQLAGEIPSELGSLASLQELHLWGNGLRERYRPSSAA